MNSRIFRVAIVGAATLKGKELADVLNDRNFPAVDVKLLDDDESLGQLEAVGEEISFVQSVKPDQFENVDFTFFASEAGFTQRHWEIAKRAGSAVIDLSYALENQPGARVRAPWIERELKQPVTPELAPDPVVTAHPAAQVLALLVLRAQAAGALRAVSATVIEPASEHGKRGMDELHEQTVNLLSFRDLPKSVYDAQVAFNVISRYGNRAPVAMESIERRILEHYAAITAGLAPVPSLMLLQAASFHGHTFSVYIEPETRMSEADLSLALSGEHVHLTQAGEESPSNVSAAGQEEIVVAVRPNARGENGYWLWAAADNLRITALSAVECAETMAMARPRGTVQ